MTSSEEATSKRLKISLKVPAAKYIATEHSEHSSKNSDLSDVSSFWSDEEEETERSVADVYSEIPAYGSGKKRKLASIERDSTHSGESSDSDEEDYSLDSATELRRKSSLIDVKEEPSEAMFKQRKALSDLPRDSSLVSSQSPDKNGAHTKILLKPSGNKSLGSPMTHRFGQAAKHKDLNSTLHKLLESFIKKDAYGFFLEPVDTSVVTDYREIIKNPMDFGTIRKKIEKRFYRSLDEFKSDFELVCNNAKTYNAPETLYYKNAHKIWQYGLRAIEKERPNVVERFSPKLDDDVDVEGLIHENHVAKGSDTQQMPIDTPRVLQESGPAAESSRSQTPMKIPGQRGRKPSAKSAIPKRLFDGQFKYAFRGDGSLDPGADLDSFIPQSTTCPEVPNLTVITSFSNPFTENVFKRASFLDYGPFATLGPAPPPVTIERSNFLFNTYGDERGFAYSQSIQEFLKDVGGDLEDYCQNTLSKLTKGAHSLANKVQEIVEKKLDAADDSSIEGVIETDLGHVDVLEEIKRLERLPKLRQEISELEQWRKQVIDLDTLFKDSDWKQPEIFSTRIDQSALQSLLDKNKEAIKKLISSPSITASESPTSDGTTPASQEGVLSNGSAATSNNPLVAPSATTLSPPIPNNTLNGLTQPTTSESNPTATIQHKDALQEEVRLRLFQLARCAPTSEISTQRPILRPGASVISPITMARTTQGLPTTPTSIKVAPRLTKPPSANPTPTKAHKPSKRHDPDKPQLKCANCGTSDTPGWRAGETPDTKLCNACGLYFAKNKTHRPSHLWNR